VEAGGDPDFVVAASGNQLPDLSALDQFRADGITFLPTGGATNESVALFKAIVGSGDFGQQVRMHVEVREEMVPFSNTPTASSDWVLSGTEADVLTGSFEEGKSYHWQAWSEDTNGISSGAIAFGGAPDFTKILNEKPFEAIGADQFGLDGVTAIPVGGTTSSPGVILRAMVDDLDGDLVRLEVEIQPLGQPFAGVASARSSAVVNGTETEVLLPELSNRTDYHWRYRVVDSSNDASDWVSFGENPEGDSDIYLDSSYYVASHVENHGGGGGGGCGGSVLSSKGLSLVGILALLGGLLLAAGSRRRIWTA
jgi:hypothetical protein